MSDVLGPVIGGFAWSAVGGEVTFAGCAVLFAAASAIIAWGVGIVGSDSDLAFTALNVLAHGIPYLALVWLHGRTRAAAQAGAAPNPLVAARRSVAHRGP